MRREVELAQAAVDRLSGPVAPQTPPKRFRLLTAAELHTLPRQTWVVHGVLPATGTAAIYGASGSGKSFLLISIVRCLAEDGGHWFGHKVKGGSRIVVVVLEGEAGFRSRIEADEKAAGRPFPESVRFVFQPFNLTDRSDVLAMAAAIDAAGGGDVVMIDTLNRAAPGADENTSRDMGLIIEATKELQGLTGGLVLLVHHAGKDAGKGLRGHSSLHGALDAAIEVARSEGRREWTLAKAKDGADGEVHPFRLEPVDLGEDEEGEPITSCVVVPVEAQDAPQRSRPRLPKGGNQRIVYDALAPLFRESQQFGKAGAPAVRPCIPLDAAIAHARDRLTVSSDRRTERTRQAITGLITSGVMGCNEDWLWLV